MNNRKTRRQTPPATLRIGGIAAVPAALADFGIDARETLAAAGIDPDLLDDPNNMITYAARNRLFKICVAETGCQHFGLLVGQRMNLQSFGLLGLLMRNMPDAGAALRALVTYLHIHTQGAITTLQVAYDLATLRYDVTQPMAGATDQIGDGAVAVMLNSMRTLCGPGFQAIEASFAHHKPADIKPFKKFFRTPLHFDAAHSGLVFSRKWLNVRVPGADGELRHQLQQQIDAIKANHGAELPEQVRNVLRSALLTGHYSEEQIAALFGMTSRTLIRRLQSFDTGFRELVDECRHDLARQMLENSSLTIGEVADALGYTRASAFIRAFRRWTGTTPGLWRAQQS